MYEVFPGYPDICIQWHCGECQEYLVRQAVGACCLNLSCDQYGKIFSLKTLNRKDRFMLTINEMADAAYKNSVKKGFWDEHPTGPLHPETIASKLALIHSEVSEALEDARDGNMASRCDATGKPVGFGSELADIVIRVGDLAKRLGIDLGEEVTNKMVFNATRPHKHGRKI